LHCLSCHILFMPCILFDEPFILSPYFSLVILRIFYKYIFWGWQLKARQTVLFCLDISKPLFLMTCLILSYMPRLDIISFSISMSLLFFCFIVFKIKKKKKFGVKMQNFFSFFFDKFSDIVCVFAWYLSSLCIDWICLYMIESLCLISANFFLCI